MKAIIIEDEKLIAKDLENKIKEVATDVEIIEIIPSVKTALKWFLNNEEPDLMFMDIQLSDGISFDIFDSYNLNCPVIFTTAYNDYAMRAFKVNGVDYLLKPVDEMELKRAIEKCRAILASKAIIPVDIKQMISDYKNPSSLESKFKEKFIVNFRNQWIPINVSDIAFFMRDTLNKIYTMDGNSYNFDFSTLDEIEESIDNNLFFRANRQFIIHIDTIHTVKPVENQKLVVRLKEPNHKFEIDISREKAPAFKKWLNR
ncbi:MAG: response regulator transcription factor [Bacteroidetes bacterium]|nr:response regulator transcription factor [Bacteroidota bacterium]